MKKHNSKEAFYDRLKQLAEVNKTSVKESQTRNLGTLIDYKRAADGVAYGIIREQHNYYVKKGGMKQDPDVSDFAYIGGLSNITNFQYKSLAEADKQRNMLFHTISEAVSLKPSKTGSKKRLNEDKAGEEIAQAAEKVDDLDAATTAATAPVPEVPAEPAGDVEMAAGLEAEPTAPEGGEEMPAPEGGEEVPAMDAEVPAPEGGEEVAPEGGEEMPAPEGGEEELPAEEPEGGEDTTATPEDEKGLIEKEVEKSLGKLTNKIRKLELEPSQVKSYVNSFLSAFKGKFDDVEIEDRKAMADKILKVVPDEDVEDLGAEVPQEEPEADMEVAEQQCAECGGFGKYAESRGYDSPEAFMECGEEEQGNVISGYANAHNDGMNDGDFKMVALLVNPEMIEKLKGEYGHEDYAEKLTPYTNELSEASEEDKLAQINELWGGLKSMFGKVGGDVKAGAQKVGQAVGGAVQKGAQAVAGAAQKAGQAVGQYATGVKQAYHTGEVPGEVKKLEGIALDLGKQVAALNARLQKAGQQPVNVKSLLQTISNQVAKGGTASLGKYGVAAEGMVDPGNVEVQPNMLKEDDEPEEEIETGEVEAGEVEGGEEEKEKENNFFAPEAQSLGGGVVKPESAPMTTVDVTIQPDKTVEIQMNETETKLRKYIRARLEEKVGLRKAKLTEGKKSPTLLKLDSVIDKQFKLYEAVAKKKGSKPFVEATKKIKEGNAVAAKAPKGGKLNVSDKKQPKVVDEGFGDFITKGVNVVNQAVEGKYRKQKELKAAIEADPQRARSALTNAFSTELKFNAGLQKFINMATPENALQVAQQAANDPDGLGKVVSQRGVLAYIPAKNIKE